MDMNRTIAKAGSVIVTVTVLLFALFLMLDIPYWQFFVCFFLPIGFVLMTAGLRHECEMDRAYPGTEICHWLNCLQASNSAIK